jgi:hypothetical protein
LWGWGVLGLQRADNPSICRVVRYEKSQAQSGAAQRTSGGNGSFSQADHLVPLSTYAPHVRSSAKPLD